MIPKSKPNDWTVDLLRSNSGALKAVLVNAYLIFTHAPEWQGVLGYDQFSLVTKAMKPPPWENQTHNFWRPREWTEQDDRMATSCLQASYGLCLGTSGISEAVEMTARLNSFHPVRDYLNELRWDEDPRVNEFAVTYLGAADTSYAREVGQCVLISAVARIMEPGCKADHMLILEGPQGSFKSTAIKILGDPWTTDDLDDIGSKDAAMQLSGRWLVEVAELAAMGKPAVEKLKAFLSRSTDIFRPPYGKRVGTYARQCAFIGTTNSEAYLQDATGGRRFWPIKCGNINLEALKRDRDQIWAEAFLRYKSGEQWWLDSATSMLASQEQQERLQLDPWHEEVQQFVSTRGDVSVPEVLHWIKDRVDISTKISLSHPKVGQWNQTDQNRVARCLVALGWQQYRPGKVPGKADRPGRRYRRQLEVRDQAGTGP